MKLIVGIGNPDPEYQGTRHNVGWLFLDWLEKRYKDGEIEGVRFKTLRPDTYVNETGKAVKKAKAKAADLVLVQDDLDIPFGMCKLSFDKNSGGHKGVESVMRALGTKKFHRIRIGIGVRALDKARAGSDKSRDEFVRSFVLKKFTAAESKELGDIFKACEVRLLQALKTK